MKKLKNKESVNINFSFGLVKKMKNYQHLNNNGTFYGYKILSANRWLKNNNISRPEFIIAVPVCKFSINLLLNFQAVLHRLRSDLNKNKTNKRVW